MTTDGEPFGDDWAADWRKACSDDAELSALATASTVTFSVHNGHNDVVFSFQDGEFVSDTTSSPEFEVRAPDEAWSRFFERVPRPPFQSFFGMLMRVDGAEVRGSELRFAQFCHLVRRVLELGRRTVSGEPTTPAADRDRTSADEGRGDSITGRYRNVEIDGQSHRVYYEEAGSGRDVLLLHTAGADARQFCHLLNDDRLIRQCRLVAPDLPWHGRSFPPAGALPGSYALSTDRYADTVIALVESLGLRAPIVMGASMAGLICLELAYRRPDLFGGVVACEASDVVPNRQVRWALHPEVNQAVFVPEWVDGLMAPQTSEQYRREIWWTYSQAGFGTFFGDILFYSGDFNAVDRIEEIDTTRCPVVMMTGEYDYSCTPEMSRRTAERIPGAVFRVMPELGHFPHAENPGRFAGHLLDAIGVIDT